MIELDHNALYHALKKEAFHSSILEMELAGAVQKVLLRDYQMHPWKQIILHIDFQRIDETTRLHKKVPLHFVNEENSVAVKTDKCLVNHVQTDLEVEVPGFAAARVHHHRSGRPGQGPVDPCQRAEASPRHQVVGMASPDPDRLRQPAARGRRVVADAHRCIARPKARRAESENKK
jgi:hypothetical protein